MKDESAEQIKAARDELAAQLLTERETNRALKLDRSKTQRRLIYALMLLLVFFVSLNTTIVDPPEILTSVVQTILTLLGVAFSFYFKTDGPPEHD